MGVWILFVSICLQFTAAGLALNFVRRTSYRLAWGTMATALTLMGIRRSITFWKVRGEDVHVLDPTAESVALVISLLMLTGVVLVARMFESEARKSADLEAARRFLRQTIDAAPMVISIKDENQRFLFTNQFSAERFGLEPEAFEGKTIAETLGEWADPQFIHSTSKTDSKVISTGEEIPFFEETMLINGESRYMLTSKTPITDSNDNASCVLTMSLDITPHKQAEMALAASEEQRLLAVERLKNAIANMRNGFVLYDSKGRIEFFNESFCRFNKYEVNDLVSGVTTYHELGLLDRKHAKEDYHPLTFEERLRLLHQNGPTSSVHHVDDRVYERQQSATPEGGIIGLITDITDQKNAETALIKSLELAEKANAAKSEFLASMSHELRTPLNAVLGFTQLLKMDADKTLSLKQKGYLEDVLQGGNHLLSLINEVLDLAKIEADEVSLGLDAIDVAAVVAESLSLLEPLRAERRVQITNNLSRDETSLLRADKTRLRQILLNLLSNALRFNEANGTVSVIGTEAAEGLYRITVTDSGHGIPENEQANVFNMFHQVGRHSEIAKEGTGIGLYVCKLLTEKMDGKIGFESTEGVGSAFWIELPLATNLSNDR